MFCLVKYTIQYEVHTVCRNHVVYTKGKVMHNKVTGVPTRVRTDICQYPVLSSLAGLRVAARGEAGGSCRSAMLTPAEALAVQSVHDRSDE